MEKVWQKFSMKVAAWIGVALALQFLTTIFLGGPPPYLVPGILATGALQIGLLDRTPLPAGNGRMLKRGIGLLMITFAVWIGTQSAASARGKISWLGYSEEILEAARKGGRPVLIDFVSRNCPHCDAMDRNVFSNNRVAAAAKEFIAVRVDLTEGAAGAQALAEKFGVEGLPTIIFLGPDGKERSNLRLVGFENARFFAERLESAR